MKFSRTSLLLFFFIFVGFIANAQRALLDSAIENYEKQNYERSFYWFDKLSKTEQVPAIYLYKGQVALLTKRYTSALRALNKVIELDPDMQTAYLLKGLVYQSIHDDKQAVLTFRQGYLLNDEDLDYLTSLAYAEFLQTNYEHALRLYKQLAKQKDWDDSGNNYFERRKLAELYFILRKDKKAYVIMNKMIKQQLEELEAAQGKSKVFSLKQLVESYTTINDYETAKNYTLQGIALDSTEGDFYSHLGYYYIRTLNADSALYIFSRIEENNMNEGDKINLLYSLAYAGKSTEAIKIADELLRLYPTFSNIYGNRGLAYLRQKNYEMAEQDFKKALELKPNNPWVFRWLGTLYLEQGNQEKACEYFNKATKLAYGPVHFMADPTILVEKHCK